MPKQKRKPSNKQLQNLVLGGKRIRTPAQAVARVDKVVSCKKNNHNQFTQYIFKNIFPYLKYFTTDVRRILEDDAATAPALEKGTSMHGEYTKQNPSPATLTKLDKMRDKLVSAYQRIMGAREPRAKRSSHERVMLLQFIFAFVHDNNSTITAAINEAQRIFHWKRQSLFAVVNGYLSSEEKSPAVEVSKKRGRGSELFMRRYGDQFCKIKNVHIKEILKYVREANKNRGGMVTAGRIQAHLLNKFDIIFKRPSIYYALTKRLGLKYANSGKPKIIFSPER